MGRTKRMKRMESAFLVGGNELFLSLAWMLSQILTPIFNAETQRTQSLTTDCADDSDTEQERLTMVVLRNARDDAKAGGMAAPELP
jgi:hypothetical protein